MKRLNYSKILPPRFNLAIQLCFIATLIAGCGGPGRSRILGAIPDRAVRKTSLVAANIAYDAKRDLVYTTDETTETVTFVTPKTGSILTTVPITGKGGNLSISSDDSKLYVTQGGFIQRIDLASRKVDQSFYVNSFLSQFPFAPISAEVVRVQPSNAAVITSLIMDSAQTQNTIWSVTSFTSGVPSNTLTSISGFSTMYDLQYSTDGTTVYIASTPGVQAFPVSSQGKSGLLAQSSKSIFGTTAEARGKLYIGPSAFDEHTNNRVGAFAVSTPTWLFSPDSSADRAISFTCGTTGEKPMLQVLSTASFKVADTFALGGLPAVAGGGVRSLTVTGNRAAFLLTDPKTQTSTLAFVDF